MPAAADAGWELLPANPATRAALRVLEGVLEELLETPYVARAKSVRLHDAVWGTIELRAHERALLDAPLFQRLRHIRQLSGTYMVFPSAVHTRFEHTVGVLGIAEKMACALGGKAEFDAHKMDSLRFAALCHDLGHGPFSHCSEPFMAGLEPMPAALALLPGSHAAEVMSWLIVTSAPMRMHIGRLNRRFGTELDCDLAAAIIVGRMPPCTVFLGEIVHGAIDADKIDYLNRDALFCGLHAQVDIDRLLAIVDVAELTGSDGVGRRKIVCAGEGLAALLQLVQHKLHLHSVAYHHPAARSFACMLDAALRAAHDDAEQICGVRLQSAADLLRIDDFAMLCNAPSPGGEAGCLLRRLRLRRLHKLAAMVLESDVVDAELLRTRAADLQASVAQGAPAWSGRNLISPANFPSLDELRDLHVRRNGRLIPLDETLPLAQLLASLQPATRATLLFSPVEHVEKVRLLAQKILPSGAHLPAMRT